MAKLGLAKMAVLTRLNMAVAVTIFTCVCNVSGQQRATPAPCTSSSSYYEEFQCNNGIECYNDHDQCNSYSSCTDKTDDLDCDSCSYDAFYCQLSRQCVSEYDVCNGYSDCPNGEDESLPECFPTIWLYWTGGQLAGIIIGFVVFLVIVIAIVVVVHKKCKK